MNREILEKPFAPEQIKRRQGTNGDVLRLITDEQAKLVIYRAFIESELSIPRTLARNVHRNYFEPSHEEFAPRTMWSLLSLRH